MNKLKNKENKCLLIIIILLICSIFNMNAQVMIGSGDELKDYAIIQIEGTDGGLRLPKLNEEERKKMELTFDTNASGLIIYYTPESTFQFWDGNRWITMKYFPSLGNSTNGISGSETFILSGQLTEFTEILQGDKNVYFDVSTGRFSVGNNIFVVNKDGVGINKTPLNTLLDVQSPTVEGLRIRTQDEVLAPDYVLVSDNQGNASWQTLEPDPYSRMKTLNDNLSIASTATAETPIQISDTLNLTHGVWLIVARYIAESSTNTTKKTDYGYLSWIRLREYQKTNDIAAIGTLPQFTERTATEGRLLATPQLAYIIEVPTIRQDPSNEDSPEKGVSYALWGDLRHAGGINFNIKNTMTGYGSSYIYAIRLSF